MMPILGNGTGKNARWVVRGSAGVGFAEDIFCFYKGLHPERGDRLMLQLRYGIRSYYSTFDTRTP